MADGLIGGDERAVSGDRACEHKARRRRLKAQGIEDRIMPCSHNNQPGLASWQRRRNALIAPIRASVEHLFSGFGAMKRRDGCRRGRPFSLARNALQFELPCIATTLRRAERLTA